MILPRHLPIAIAAIAAAACSTGRVDPAPTGGPGPAVINAPAVATRWPVRSLPHVDLWIHSFAMIANDTTAVPLYRRGYRDSVTVVKNSRNVLTALDANQATLARGLAANPAYLQAQFLAFEFQEWDQMRVAIERFLQFQGDPQRAPDRATAQAIAVFANVFRTTADREWLRLFLSGVIDEASRFYLEQRAQAWRERSAVVTAVDSLWQQKYRTQFDRYLTNTGQRTGDMLLSMPLGAEGRATTGFDGRSMVAVSFPARPGDAVEALLVFAHEITGGIVGSVVSDNTSPAEKRSGAADRMVAFGQVRAGASLLERIAPDLLEPYVRFYLEQAGKPAGTGMEALARAFPLPDAVTEGMKRQIDVVLGGI
jgi:hypothetical protein